MAEMTKPEGLAESIKRLGRFADWLYWRATHTKALENGNRHGLLRTRLDPKHLAEAVKDIRTVLDALAESQASILYWEEEAADAERVRDGWIDRAEKAEAALREAQEECTKHTALLQGWSDYAAFDDERKERENQLRAALEKIAAWEMPPVFNREGKPSRMSLEYGSNGERDYIRSVARAALSPIPAGNLWCNNHNLERTEPGPECPKCVTERRSPIPAAEPKLPPIDYGHDATCPCEKCMGPCP